MPKRKPLTASQRREAEHKAFLRALTTMSKLAMKQAEVLGSFMKTYEVASPPESRVMTEEREWLNEQAEDKQLLQDMAAVQIQNPFLGLEQ